MANDLAVLALEDLKSTVFVRRALSEDRVLQFMELYRTSDHQIPPIEVVRDTFEIKDGRHRREALVRLGRKTTTCKLVAPADLPELLISAFDANFGGPMPPTRGDIVFVMKQLITAGLRHSQILEKFRPYYPPSVIRTYLDDAYTDISKQKMRSAVAAVATGDVTVAYAAQQHGVSLESLQNEIGGRKKRGRKVDVGAIKSDITNRSRGLGTKNVTTFRQLLQRYEDGEISYAKVLEVMLHVKRLHTDGAKRVDSWLERLEGLKLSMKS